MLKISEKYGRGQRQCFQNELELQIFFYCFLTLGTTDKLDVAKI